MEATGWVAIYAAAVSTGSLGWQVWTRYQASRPRVTVYLETWRTTEAPGRRLLEDAKVHIRNREEHAVQVDWIFLHYPGTKLRRHVVPAVVEDGALPVEVPAQEVVPLTIRPKTEYVWPQANEAPRDFAPGVSVILRTGEHYKSWNLRNLLKYWW